MPYGVGNKTCTAHVTQTTSKMEYIPDLNWLVPFLHALHCLVHALNQLGDNCYCTYVHVYVCVLCV